MFPAYLHNLKHTFCARIKGGSLDPRTEFMLIMKVCRGEGSNDSNLFNLINLNLKSYRK